MGEKSHSHSALPPKSVPRKHSYEEYLQHAKDEFRAMMNEARVNYSELAQRLSDSGYKITARGLENKISRGSFSFAFYQFCLDLTIVDILA